MMAGCIACNNIETTASFYPKLAFNNKIFEFRKCTTCGLVYLVPSLTDEDTQKLYGEEYHDEFYFKSGPGRNKKHQTGLLKRFKPNGRILDYGCGDASFLVSLQKEGYDVNGAEYDPKLVDKLRSSHPGIKFYSITSLAESGKFDVIHLCDVLGQVADPAKVLQTLKAYLAPGGILFVESPVEHNFHLLFLFRAGYFRLRKWISPQRVVAGKPFRVIFSNRKNQELFFKNNGYSTLYYEIFEWAWPLPDEWKDARSLKQKAQYLLGATSKFFSRIVPHWGNRFYYIGSLSKNSNESVR